MADLKQYLVDETVEDFARGRITRRAALATLTGLIGAIAGAQLLAACGSNDTGAGFKVTPPASPDRVAPDDPAVTASAVEFPGEGTTLHGYLARPARAGAHPLVLVCHENRGLTPYIEDVSRRLAKAGYVGLAVDLVSRDGGTASQPTDAVPGLLGNVPPARHVGDFLAAVAYARTLPAVRADRIGMTGFCFGGGVTWRVAAALPELRAAVPYYGMPVDADKVVAIQAAVLAIYAGKDDRINKAIPAIEAEMAEAGKTFRKVIYPGVDHAFHNDTRDRYAPAAAQAAWRETLAWFAKYLA